jgi:hypothetical protein
MVMKITNYWALNMQFPPSFFQFLALRSKYSSQQLLLIHLLSYVFPFHERSSFTTIQTTGKIIVFSYFNLYLSW